MNHVLQTFQPTKEQTREFKKAFDLIDKNGDGVVSTSELGTAMQSIGLSPTEDELKDMVKSVDADGSGTVDFAEFHSMVFKEFNKSKIEELREIFRTYDKNNDGTITAKELRDAFNEDGNGLETDNEIIKKIFEETDFDKDGKIKIEGEWQSIHILIMWDTCYYSVTSS